VTPQRLVDACRYTQWHVYGNRLAAGDAVADAGVHPQRLCYDVAVPDLDAV